MILRDMKKKLLQLATKFPVVSVTGPRQSGKSTLIKSAFPTYTYLSLEDPSTRELFRSQSYDNHEVRMKSIGYLRVIQSRKKQGAAHDLA